MPFERYRDPLSSVTGYAPTSVEEERDVSAGDVLGAAFSQENLIGSTVSLIRNYQSFAPDPNFTTDQLLEVIGPEHEALYLDEYLDVRSADEARYVRARIERERQAKEILDAAGAWGDVATLGAAVLDPTSLLPGGAVYKAGRLGWRAARSALSVGAAAGVATAVQEAGLHATQQTRTLGESAANVAGAAVFGGILGGAAGLIVRRADIERVGQMIEAAPETLDELNEAWGKLEADVRAESAGAAAVSFGEARLKGSGVDEVVAKTGGLTSPLLRTQTSEVEATRVLSARLAESPRTLAQAADGQPVALGGAVETRLKMWEQRNLANALMKVDDLFSQYYYGRKARIGDDTRAEISALVGLSGGKLSPTQFREEVGKALRRNDDHPIPEVAAAARIMRQEVFDPLKDAAINVGLLPPDVKTTTADSYFTRVYNTEKIVAQRHRWSSILIDYLTAGQSKAARQVEYLADEISKREVEIQMLQERQRVEVEDVLRRLREARKARKESSGLLRERRKEMNEARRAFERQERQEAREENTAMAALLRDLRRGGRGAKPKDIVQFIRAKGGVRGARVDALGRAKYVAQGAAEIRQAADSKARTLFRRDGVEPEDLLRMAVEEGYLKPDASMDDLVNAIDETFRGRPVYSEHDLDELAYAEDIARFAEELARQGVNLEELTPEALADIMRGGEGRPLSEAARRLAAEVEAVTRAFDEAAVRVEELDRFLRWGAEVRPELKEAARSFREAMLAARKEIARLQRDMQEPWEFSQLSRDEIAGIVDQITDEIIASPDGRILYQLTPGPRGPLRERTLKIPDHMIEDFLESDVGLVGRIYTRTMGADVELTREFGEPSMVGEMAKIVEAYDRRMNQSGISEAERARLQRRLERDISDLSAMRDRIRGTYALPKDPRGIILRASRVVKDWNYLALLGGMTVSAIPDMGRPVMVHGLTRTFQAGWKPLVTNWRAVKLARKELKAMGAAVEMALNSRSMSLFDVMDNYGRGSKFERASSWAASRFGAAALMAPWNDAMKQISGMVAMTRILQASRDWAAGKISKRDMEALAAAGIDERLARTIAAEFDRVGEDAGGVLLPHAERWQSREARDAFTAAVIRDVDRIIVTPGQDKPLWMSTPLGSFLGQFKSFAFSSMEKVFLAGLEQRDAAALNGALLMLALGAASYWAKAQLAGREVSDNPAVWAMEAFDNSGLGGWLMEANNMADKLGLGLGRLTGEQASRYASRNLAGTFLGPSLDLVQDMGQVVRDTAAGEWTESTTHAFRKHVPLQNLFYLRWLFDRAEAGFNEALGVPATARQ